MQIVIDIPDHTYNYIMGESQHNPRGLDYFERHVSNGIPLEKVLEDIKAEIEAELNLRSIMHPYYRGLEFALEIIDKHISGKESE